jgi:hypothetical protein
VVVPLVFDPAVVAEVLGDEPLALDLTDRVLAPYLTIDGRIHGPTSDFLRYFTRARPNPASCDRR